jgi:DNA-binding MarR family transcriptional regulator
MKDPLRGSYHNIALGSETFIEKIKEKIENLGRKREISSTRTISKYDVDIIITKITQVLNIKRRMISPLSLSKIGELFEMDYSAVSQAAKRFEQKSEVNNEIKENMQKVITALKEI